LIAALFLGDRMPTLIFQQKSKGIWMANLVRELSCVRLPSHQGQRLSGDYLAAELLTELECPAKSDEIKKKPQWKLILFES
jgi:hypothetical protein